MKRITMSMQLEVLSSSLRVLWREFGHGLSEFLSTHQDTHLLFFRIQFDRFPGQNRRVSSRSKNFSVVKDGATVYPNPKVFQQMDPVICTPLPDAHGPAE
jgi:hypothetical protein